MTQLVGARPPQWPRSHVAWPIQHLVKMHEMLVDEAPWLWIVHDGNPRAMSKKVQGFVSAQAWFVDLTRVSLP